MLLARLLAIEFSAAFQLASVNTKYQSYLHDAVEHIQLIHELFRHPLRASTEALEHGNAIVKSILKFLCSYRMSISVEKEDHRSLTTGEITHGQSYNSCCVKQVQEAEVMRKIINNLVPNRSNKHAATIVNESKKLAPTCLQKGQAEKALKLKYDPVLTLK